MAEAEAAYPGANRFDVQLPYALALSTEQLAERFDAIIVDEGQDFRSDYWLPLEMLLAEDRQSVFYVFYDHNQAIYNRLQGFPDLGDPFLLLANCRNTRWIHAAAYEYYRGDTTDPPDIDGARVEAIEGEVPESQAHQLHAHIVALLQVERIRPADIAVLIAGAPKQRYYDLLRAYTLPRGIKWAVEDHEADAGVLLETAARFKGLERAVVFLWGIDELDSERDLEVFYVGLSRAKSRLVVIGRPSSCRAVLGRRARSDAPIA